MFIVIDIYRGLINDVFHFEDITEAIQKRDRIDAYYREHEEESDSFAALYAPESNTSRMHLITEEDK